MAFPRDPKRLLGELAAADTVRDAAAAVDLRRELQPGFWELLLRPLLFAGSLGAILALYAAFPEGTPLKDLRRLFSLAIAWLYLLSVLFALDWLIYKVRRLREVAAWQERRLAALEATARASAGGDSEAPAR